MKALQEIKIQIEQVKNLVEANNNSDIRLNANGGNSVLLVCPPDQEQLYIKEARNALSQDRYEMIDLNQLLIDFIRQHKEELLKKFDLLQTSVHQIFKSPPEENDDDFFRYLIKRISEAFKTGKIPFLYSVGALYGTGIDNIQIIEHERIMKAQLPLVILYPATDTEDKLMFLNSRPASKYRCIVIK